MIKEIVKIMPIIFLAFFNNFNLFSKNCDVSNISKEIYKIVVEFNNGSLSEILSIVVDEKNYFF